MESPLFAGRLGRTHDRQRAHYALQIFRRVPDGVLVALGGLSDRCAMVPSVHTADRSTRTRWPVRYARPIVRRVPDCSLVVLGGSFAAYPSVPSFCTPVRSVRFPDRSPYVRRFLRSARRIVPHVPNGSFVSLAGSFDSLTDDPLITFGGLFGACDPLAAPPVNSRPRLSGGRVLSARRTGSVLVPPTFWSPFRRRAPCSTPAQRAGASHPLAACHPLTAWRVSSARRVSSAHRLPSSHHADFPVGACHSLAVLSVRLAHTIRSPRRLIY
jgi:hypothetical protein